MPTINKIRLTNVVYEDGDKRFNDDLFLFDGHNAAIVLENGGGKTVFIHTVLQAILPHTHLGERKIRETLKLDQAPAHIAIEWMINERPRRYLVTAVSLFMNNDRLDSYRYVFEYEENHPERIENIPFAIEMKTGERPASREEIREYYSGMAQTRNAHTFDTLTAFHEYIENTYYIIHDEWKSIVKINEDEGGIEKFFERCRTTADLYDRLLIPIVEDSIAGHDEHTFADTFEKQRKAFQKYHELQKSMEEHRLIQEHLESYVQEVKSFSEKEANFLAAKQHAKGLLDVVINDRTDMERQLESNEQNWQAWKENKQFHKLKKDSFDILKQRQKRDTLEKDYKEKLAIHQEKDKELTDAKNTYDSLRYARAKEQLVTNQQLKENYEAELAKYDEQYDVATLEEQLAMEHAKLHGYFIEKFEQIEREIRDYQFERRPLVETKTNLAKRKQGEEQRKNKAEARLNKLFGQIETKQKDRKELRQKLISHQQEKVQDVYSEWTIRQQELDEEIIHTKERIRTSKQRNIDLHQELEKLVEKDHNFQVRITEIEAKQRQIKEAHQDLINDLGKIRPNWQSIADIYLQQATVRETLQSLQRRLDEEREDVFVKERLALRFVDDYGEQDIFVSDPYVAEQLESMQNEFYLRSGVEYYQDLPEDVRERVSHYTLWPLTLITTEDFKGKVLDRLTTMKDRLQYPITILTLDEVTQLEVQSVDGTWIAPSHWEHNLYEAQFAEWKVKLKQEAEKMTEKRRKIEKRIEKHQTVYSKFNTFFLKFPKEKSERLYDEISEMREEQRQVKRKMMETREHIQKTEDEIVSLEDTFSNLTEEKGGLDRRIEIAQDYFQVENELNELEKEKDIWQRQVSEYERSLQNLVTEIERYKEEISLLDENIREQKWQLENEKASELFKEVKSERPIFQGEEKAVILERRKSLEFEIRGIRESYDAIHVRLEGVQNDIEREQKVMAELLQENEQIDVDMDVPVDTERRIEQTREQMHQLRDTVQGLEQEVSKARSSFEREDELVVHYEEQFKRNFPGERIYVFQGTIEQIARGLEDEEKELAERENYLLSEQKRMTKEMDDIEEAERLLEKYNYSYEFDSTVISAIELTQDERIEFSYARVKFTEGVGKSLRQAKEDLEQGKEQIEGAKNKFRQFINRTVSEPKFRQLALEGIDTKTTYDEILAHQANMLKTLESANKYARNFIAQNDELLQAFITNIHNHLTTVVEQLKSIARHTRVKVDDEWRDIYRFHIPEWSEEDGKARIREYMEWILEQLEQDHFKDDQGNEDSGKIRKEIETWLDTRQLLQVVMEQKMMRVSCRKVTNDNRVTTRLTTWEQSNRWSGGEKWSKNMTLFLGILNFVAEKRQHQNQTMQRHRAVILDNPFGKASSDHVLNPVFFIAEQLGFQIIALTAHADGKFLQDHFPIIYSLRLRMAKDGRRQVVDKTKSLHYAYFQDHDPAALERLEESEQLSFDTM